MSSPASEAKLGNQCLAKWCSLVCLVGQCLAFGICFRSARLVPAKVPFSNLSLMCISEVAKLVVSVMLVCFSSGLTGLRTLVDDGRSCFFMAVPGILYALQNWLYFVGITNLSVSLFQVTKQFQIFTSAFLAVIALRTRLNGLQWTWLVVLTCGVVGVSMNGDVAVKGDLVTGLASNFVAAWLSAAAGVYTEYMLKGVDNSLWQRNAQLSSFGILFGLCTLLANESERMQIASNGFFAGYNTYTWGVGILQVFGGLLTSAVLKYADNVLKVVVKSLAMALSAILSRVLFNEGPDLSDVTFQVALIAIIISSAFYALGHEWLFACCKQAPARDSSEFTKTADDQNKSTSPSEHLAVQVGPSRLGYQHGNGAKSAADGECENKDHDDVEDGKDVSSLVPQSETPTL